MESTMADDKLIEVLTQRASLVLTRAAGVKHDGSKPMVSLIDPSWLLEVAEVLTFGATKYTPDNWKHVDNAQQRYLSAAYRHLLAYQKGLENDSESNLSHLAHATCCLMFLHYLGRNSRDERESE
jgi:hypothetical protein